jgi:hypothetical protein
MKSRASRICSIRTGAHRALYRCVAARKEVNLSNLITLILNLIPLGHANHADGAAGAGGGSWGVCRLPPRTEENTATQVPERAGTGRFPEMRASLGPPIERPTDSDRRMNAAWPSQLNDLWLAVRGAFGPPERTAADVLCPRPPRRCATADKVRWSPIPLRSHSKAGSDQTRTHRATRFEKI